MDLRRLAILGLLWPCPAMAATLTIDLGAALKPVDHAASGALYGVAGPGWPPLPDIAAIRPRNFTQMPPGGHQLPNGEKQPVGDALVVAPLVAGTGATVTIRLPDVFPDFPYLWTGQTDWAAAVDRIVHVTVAAAPTNIYAYELWNEPDWNWQSQWGDFDRVWASTYAQVHGIDPSRRIMGPSASKWDPAWMERFLRAAMASSTVPDIVSWHELDPATTEGIEAHVAAYRALEARLGLQPRPISIDEYGAQRDMADPGALVHYIAQFERAGVDTADLAFWHRPGRLSDLLVPVAGGTGPARQVQPTGAYWLYAWYGAMGGEMVAARPDGPAGFDGFAAYDAGRREADIVLGGNAGPAVVHVEGADRLGPIVHVVAETTDWTGTDGPSAGPVGVFSGDYRVSGGAIDISLDAAASTVATHLVVTPASLAGLDTDFAIERPATTATTRIEAEAGTITGGRRFSISMSPGNFGANRASGDAYVGFFNRAGATLSLPLEVATAGRYALAIGYSNGQVQTIAADLLLGDRKLATLGFPPTQGRELFGILATDADLPAGNSTLQLRLAGPITGMPAGPSVLEIDRVELKPEQ